MATLLTRPDDSVGTAPPGARAGGPGGSEGGHSSSLGERVRLATVCLGFLALTLSQQPGRIVADTKLDLTIDPWGWLERALTLWEPEGYAGEVQNQAYGYLFPMGPFFGLAHSAGVPGWIAQRLWMALLLSLAFLGVVALARRLRIGTPAAHLVGGLAYALAPRMLMGLGATSIEVLPMALAPWVLVPLVTGSRRGSPRRAAALSGLAVFCVGGVNAVATSAVLPLAVLWLLTRPAGPRKRRLTAWWIASVALATAWWTGPLLLLGRYSPPFLDYIETARITTATTGLLSTLRGTTQWVAYLANGEGPLWPTGWALVHDLLPIVATVALAAVGLVGLSRSRMPERAWLILGLLAGLSLVTLGHLGSVQGVLAGPLHTLLDGPLAPMRNVHKFDPVLRLPLALGVTYVSGLLFRRVNTDAVHTVGRYAARAGIVGVTAALVATASPAIAGRLSAPTGFADIPGYWHETADWLASARPSGRALLLPASSTGTYFWGSTSDEPMQALADSEWTVRSAIPLSASAHIRVLDAVEDRLSRGEGSAGLAGYLARAGISYLVVRNDLDFGAVGATRTILVEQALRNSPGIRRVASFGPQVPSATTLLGRILDDYLMPSRPAVVVYQVADPAPVAYATPLDDAVSVSGGPDGLLALEDRGLVSGRPALLADGGTTAPATALVSDAQVRRERTFGRTGDAVSAGLTADDPGRLDSPEPDYTYPGAELSQSVVRYEGGTPSASSSASDADSVRASYPENQPYAALDGDPATSWRPADRLGERQDVWWRVDTDRPLTPGYLTLRLAADHPGSTPTRVRITTDAGSRTVRLADTPDPQRFELPAGATSRVTIGVPGPTSAVLALAEVRIPGLTVERTVVTPAPTGPAAAYAFDATNPARSGCVTETTGRLRCSSALVRGAEESGGLDRAFTVAGPSAYDMAVTAVPRPGPALDALIEATARPDGPVVTASSTAVPDPRGGPDAAVDGDPRTTWVAAADDGRPSLTLTWPTPRTFDMLRLGLLPGTAAAQPTAVSVGTGGLAQDVAVDLDGIARFAPITTDTLTISFTLRDEVSSFDPYTRAVRTLGVGVSELGLTGLNGQGNSAALVDIPCGHGPTVEVDGVLHQTALRTTLSALRQLRPVQLRLCGTASTGSLSDGEHRFVARSTAAFAVSAATLTRPRPASGAAGRLDVDVQRWNRESRAVEVAGRKAPALLVVPESVNPGWVATLDGAELETRTVDGWQQGYVLPAGPAGVVTLTFRAGAVYHAALAAGAGAVLVLLAVLLGPGRGTVPVSTAGAAPFGRRRRLLTGAALALGVALVGGLTGLAALAGALALGWAARDRRQLVLGALAAGSLAAAGLVLLVASGPAAETATQVLALVAVTAVVASLWVPGRSDTTVRQRRMGRSTHR